MQVLFEYDAVDIAVNQISITTEQLDYTRKFVHAGSLPESNLVQMNAQLATDSAALINVENQLQMSRVILMQLMELPVKPGFEIQRPNAQDINPDIPLTTNEIYHTAIAILPEVKSADTKTEVAKFSLNVAQSEILPRLTLTGSLATNYSSANSLVSYHSENGIANIGYLGSNPTELVYGPVTNTWASTAYYPFLRQFGDNFGKGLSLNLVVPLFNNLIYKSDIDRARINLEVAKFNETLVRNSVRKSIEQAYTDQISAGKNYVATRQQMIAEERSYHDMAIKFKAGTINITDFFVEKNNYNKAMLTHLQAKFEYLYKSKVLDFYMGLPITQLK